MAGYIGSRASVVSSGAERKKTFDITGTTTALTGLSYTPTFVHLFHNGVRLVDGTDYTATNGTSITLTTAAQSGDQVVVVSYATFQAADAYTKAEADAGFVSDPNGAVTVDGSGTTKVRVTKPYGSRTASLRLAPAMTGTSYTSGAFSTLVFGDETVTNSHLGEISVVQTNASASTSSDMRFYTNDGGGNTVTLERMRIDSAGRVTTPSQPAFYAGGNSGWITTTSGGIVPLGAVGVNIGNGYNVSSYAYTAPVSGLYYVSLHAYLNTAAQIVLKKNGSDYVSQNADTSFLIYANGTSTGSTSGGIYLNSGDYIQMGARTAQSAYVYTGHSHFSGYLIG